MSVKIMGLVWDLDNTVINREEKYILLAYSDHADHRGYNIFPSVDLISQKTGYSERSVQLITRKLAKKGYLVEDGRGPKGTNKWRVPLDAGGAKIAPVQNAVLGGAKRRVKRGAIAITPESSEPPKEPSEGSALDFENMTVAEAKKVPSLKLYWKATNFWPGDLLWATIHKTVTEHNLTEDKLREVATAWLGRGYRLSNVTGVLEWAVNGIPQNGNGNGHKPHPVPVSVPDVPYIPPLDPEKVRIAKERFHAGLSGK